MVNCIQQKEQYLVVAGQKSSSANVRSYVPQGSISGPLLFVLFIDDMSEVVSKGKKIALYADDTKILRKIFYVWEDHEIPQEDINAMHKWSIDKKIEK
jgi:hypothetical protein